MSDERVEAALEDGEAAMPVRPAGPFARAAFYIGTFGLISAMAADALAVLGRHTGFVLLGAVEVVQASIVLIASAAIVSVTLGQGHAAVHILTERLAPGTKARLAGVADLLSALTIAALTVGSIILLVDLWHGHERSELLHIPLRVLRTLIVAALLFVCGVFLRHAFVRGRHDA